MCDIEHDRRKIDALIEMNISPFWLEDARNHNALVEVAVKCLSDEYSDICSEECLRSHCKDWVTRNMRRSLQ